MRLFNVIALQSKCLSGYLIRSKSVPKRWVSTTRSLREEAGQESSTAPSVLVEKDANITLIGLNRESKRNSIDSATAKLLSQAIYEFENDETSPVAVLYGVGGNFCAGYDLTDLEQQTDEGSFDFLLQREGSVGPTRRHLHKPIVCGINGFCVANGLELALLCDLRVMEDTAVLGFFNRRFGVPLSDGGSVRLSAMVGYARAMELIATGRRIDAAEALSIGLINRLVATGTALGQAVNLAFSIAKFPLAALQHDRNSMYTNVYDRQSFGRALQNEITYTSQEVLQEMNDGVLRFKESKLKGAKTHSWSIRDKGIPDWEKEEIARETAQKKDSSKTTN